MNQYTTLTGKWSRCRQCGATLYVTPSREAQGRGKFCSAACANASRFKPNPVVYQDADIVCLELSGGHICILDTQDYPLIAGHRWYAAKNRYTHYAATARATPRGQRIMFMHTVIMGTEASRLNDHKDRDGLNNRRANLRPCSITQNAQNRRMGRNNTSGFTGVTWDARSNRWVARISHEGRRRCLGYHRDKTMAATAYNIAARALHDPFKHIIPLEVIR